MINKLTQRIFKFFLLAVSENISKEMFKYIYPAKFIKEEKGGYSVEFLDIKGCITQGDTFEEAYYNAREALSGIIESHIENKILLPKISKKSAETYQKSPHDVRLVIPLQETLLPLIIREKRKKLKLTQQDMAKKLKVSQQAYQRLENPITFNATTKKIEQIEKILKINLLPMPI